MTAEEQPEPTLADFESCSMKQGFSLFDLREQIPVSNGKQGTLSSLGTNAVQKLMDDNNAD